MKIHSLIFSSLNRFSEETESSYNLLKEAAKKRGHTLEIITAKDCQLEFIKKPKILVNNKVPKDIKILLVRANFLNQNMDFNVATIKQFQMAGIPTVNDFLSIMRAKNKVRTMQVLQRFKIATPKSYVIRNTDYIDEVVENIHHFPVILKTIVGSHGSGVMIVESKRGLRSVAEMLTSGSEPLIVQQYVKEAKGKDLRILVVNDRIVTSMERIAKKRGEFRSNFSLGGKVRLAQLSKKERNMARAAAKAFGLEVAGVDIIRTKEGPKVLEVNCNPGLAGITEATGMDVAGRIIDYTVEKYKALEAVKKLKKK